MNKKTLGDQDAHSKVVDVVDDVEVSVEDSLKENFVTDDSWTIVWQQHFHTMVADFFGRRCDT